MNTAFVYIIGLAVLLGMALGVAFNAVDGAHVLRPCTTEAQTTDCYWDASEQGNGQGTDFIVLGGQVFYPEG